MALAVETKLKVLSSLGKGSRIWYRRGRV